MEIENQNEIKQNNNENNQKNIKKQENLQQKEQNLTILYEDNQIIVVVKPQNIPSQADITGDYDMLSMVKDYIKKKYNKQGEVFIGLVHRLDRPTGGIMVFARTSKSAKRLSEQIKNNQIEKTYYAVTTKIPVEKSGRLQNFLKKYEKENIVKIVPQSESGAKRAELTYKVLQTEKQLALLEVKLITGRSHQIRVQLAGINCPLYGDNKYGLSKNKLSGNLGLWAGRLEFYHPVTKQKMIFACPPNLQSQPWSNFYMEKYFTR